jgi:hypothetical protein
VSGFLNEQYHANQNGINFLLIDLDVAMTFIAVAETSRNEAVVRRNYDNARKAHDAVAHLLEKLTPNAEERKVIDAKLAVLKIRLQAVGY